MKRLELLLRSTSGQRPRPRPIPERGAGVGKDGSLPTVAICFSFFGPLRGRPRPIPMVGGGGRKPGPGLIIVVTCNCSFFKFSISWKYFDILQAEIVGSRHLQNMKVFTFFFDNLWFSTNWKALSARFIDIFCVEVEPFRDYFLLDFLNGVVMKWNN